MHPILFKVGPFTLHTYGVFVAMGFLAAIGFALREARRSGEDVDKILDLCFYMVIAAIIGSRFLYVIVNWSVFKQDIVEIFRIWHGGLVFYGGFIGALLTGLWYVNRKEISTWKTADMLAPAIALGHFIGRTGCFFAGCCYGRPCSFDWSITFTNPDSLAPIGVPLHPTQLYSAINGLVIFLILIGLKRFKSFNGQVFWSYVFLYGITRSAIEYFRGDDRGILLGGLVSTSQLIGLLMASIAIAMLVFLRSRHGRT